MSILGICLSILIRSSTGRPLPRDEEISTVGWVSDPNGRGTSGLIISCLLTLGLCVWSAMHLNIPPKGETQIGYWVRSLKWVVLGVFIPELVVLSAWRQWLSARKMSKELDQIFRERISKDNDMRRFKWTIAHSYYAGMGGFVFQKESLSQDEKSVYSSHDRLTLTASGVLLLARCGHLPDIDGEMIWDKSKADGLSKALVCLQAAWMILQILGRLVANQPITLLEVNTVGHIFCALVIYILWWKKPKGVNSPTVLEGAWTRPLAAYMYMSSRISGRQHTSFVSLSQWIKPEMSEYAWYPTTNSHPEKQVTNKENDIVVAVKTQAARGDTPARSFGELRERPAHTMTGLPSTVIQPVLSSLLSPDPSKEERLSAAAEAINTYPAVRELFHPPTDRCSWQKPKLVHLVTDIATNWPSDYYLPGISGELMGMALWLSSSLYGGIHIAAWSEFFPTYAEQLLWRFSATYIASSGAFWLVLCVIAQYWPWASQYWDRFIELRAWKLEYAVLGFGATICGLAYIFARVFLVVDAVVSLRRLPHAAYNTPDWTTIFPHL